MLAIKTIITWVVQIHSNTLRLFQTLEHAVVFEHTLGRHTVATNDVFVCLCQLDSCWLVSQLAFFGSQVLTNRAEYSRCARLFMCVPKGPFKHTHTCTLLMLLLYRAQAR